MLKKVIMILVFIGALVNITIAEHDPEGICKMDPWEIRGPECYCDTDWGYCSGAPPSK